MFVDSKIVIYCSLKSLLRLNVCKIDESQARALHEIPLKAAGTMQGETTVPIAFGMCRAIDVCWRFRLIIRGGKHP